MSAFHRMPKQEWEEWIAAGERTLRRPTVAQAEKRLEKASLAFDEAVRALHDAIRRQAGR